MKYITNIVKKHGMELHELRMYDQSGKFLAEHTFLSSQGVKNKLNEYRNKIKKGQLK